MQFSVQEKRTDLSIKIFEAELTTMVLALFALRQLRILIKESDNILKNHSKFLEKIQRHLLTEATT